MAGLLMIKCKDPRGWAGEWTGHIRRLFSLDANARCKAAGLSLVGCVVLFLASVEPSVAEVCHFSGTTDPAGQVAVTSEVTAADGTPRIDVAATFETTTMFWFHVRYQEEEVTIWRAGRLETVGVNTRYMFGGRIVRQTWDVFSRERDAMRGYRVQGKTLADFRARHPGFARHWDPSTFGQPWLDDYWAAPPERRADLDLPILPLTPNVMSPLALAFYWDRWLPPGGSDMQIFLPGFKADKSVDIQATADAWGGGMRWRTPLRHPALSGPSDVSAWISPDRHLMQLAVDIHHARGSGTGTIVQKGCDGRPVNPAVDSAGNRSIPRRDAVR
jgi:hypothetical protein